MHGAPAEVVAVALLAFSLAVAVFRPRGVSEAVVAVPAAGLVVLLGIVPADAAGRTLRELAPTVGFLAGVLVFGHLCDEAGVFAYLGASAARAARTRPRRLLVLVVVLAAAVTAVLTLDATVVLLTPVVLAVTRRSAVAVRPYAYACVRLANSGSLLLPVSNLTNLLAFSTTDLSFGRFAALMLLPWLLACSGEWLGVRTYFRRDLPNAGEAPELAQPAAPRYALAVLVVTVCGFVLLSSLDVPVAWAAGAGCLLLLAPRFARRDISPRRLLDEASLGFCAFVLALAVVVDAVARHGLGSALAQLVPSGSSLAALLGIAFLAALLANVVNNLPATLVLLPLVAANPAAVLAMLVGVNVGPNATFGGSLATLLWRRMLPAEERPRVREFHAFGLLSVPLIVAVATAGLWLGVRLVGV
ncbi:SLC13 family permease [Jatrophihabitans cynanchi]|uniref:SLC13 family permease n=1 Tax=Jatrophihabitans cynanchi TaxID=2944128 RepID=UPI0022B222A2|nr:SLC13 family permease [Jatrophihabitans sp. SB3-54]